MKFIAILRKQEARHWLWLALTTLLIGMFIVLSMQIQGTIDGRSELLSAVDATVGQGLINQRRPSLNGVAIDITALGSFAVLSLLVTIFVVHYWLTNQKRNALQVLAAGVGSGIFTHFLKIFFERPRPPMELRLVDVHSFSYPSGHSLSAAAVYVTLAMILAKKSSQPAEKVCTIVLFSLLVLAIGTSRIYLGAHFFSDVTAGIMLGTAWAALMAALILLYEVKTAKV